MTLRYFPRAISAWWNDASIFKIVQSLSNYITGSEGADDFWWKCENVINVVTIESKGKWKQIQHCCVYFWEYLSHRAADSNITLCTIRSEFNRRTSSKWRTWNWIHLNLTLQMEWMWNVNVIRISLACNTVGRMLVQDDVRLGEKLKMAAWNRK